MAGKTKDKMVRGAAALLRQRGVNATSVREVVRISQTPRGSVRHHFPNGKLQMVEEALIYAGNEVALPLDHLVQEAGVKAGLDAFIAGWRSMLVESDFQAGCPVLAVSLEEYVGEDGFVDQLAQEKLMSVTNEIFASWQRILMVGLKEEGVAQKRAERLATIIIASIEGTVGLCRSEKNIRPLDDVAKELSTMLGAALEN